MTRESPGYVRLMARSRNSGDIRRAHDTRSASSLFMTREERESLGSAMDYRALGVGVRREKDKFARQDLVLQKFDRAYFKTREKLAATINKNRALMELRRELQERRRAGQEPDAQTPNGGEGKPPAGETGFNHVELRY